MNPERIRYEIYKQGVSLTEMAKQLGYSRTGLSALINYNHSSPGMKVLSKNLDVDINKFNQPLSEIEKNNYKKIKKYIYKMGNLNKKRFLKSRDKEIAISEFLRDKGFSFVHAGKVEKGLGGYVIKNRYKSGGISGSHNIDFWYNKFCKGELSVYLEGCRK